MRIRWWRHGPSGVAEPAWPTHRVWPSSIRSRPQIKTLVEATAQSLGKCMGLHFSPFPRRGPTKGKGLSLLLKIVCPPRALPRPPSVPTRLIGMQTHNATTPILRWRIANLRSAEWMANSVLFVIIILTRCESNIATPRGSRRFFIHHLRANGPTACTGRSPPLYRPLRCAAACASTERGAPLRIPQFPKRLGGYPPLL